MNLNSFLRYSILTGIFLVLFLPLYVPDTMFFPFISGKNFAFRIIVELMTLAFLILMYRDASYRPKKTWMLIAMSVFVAVIAVADIFGENFYRSFWSNYERMEGLVAHLHFLAYFIVISSVLTTERLWNRFFNTSLAASTIVAFYGLGQLAGKLEIHQGAVRLDATLGNSTYLAVYMLFHIFIAGLFLMRQTTGKTMRWVYGAIILLDIFVLYHTATRGAILGFIGGAILSSLILVALNKDNKFIRKSALGIIAFIFIFSAGIFVFKDNSFVKGSPVLSRFTSISLDEATTKSRFMIWNMSWQGFKEHPILGWGQDNYIIVFNKYYNPGMYAQEPWFDRSHNVFFDWLIAGGILGLLAYLSLFVISLYYILRPGGKFGTAEKSLLIGLLSAYFFQNIFVFDNMTSYLMFFSIIAYLAWRDRGVIEVAVNKYVTKEKTQVAPPRPVLDLIYLPALALLVLFILYSANVKPILASTSLIKALTPHQEGAQKNLDYFEQVFAYGTFGSGEAREQLMQAALRVQSFPNESQEVKQKFFEVTQKEMLIQIEKNPKDARYELFFGSFLNKFGAYDDGLKHLYRAQELSPQKQQIFFEIGTSYLGKGDYRKAFQVIGEAYNSEKNFREAQFLYGLSALYAREDKLAEDLILPLYGTMLIPDDRIINVYAVRGEYGKVASLWQIRVKNDPNNADYHVALAASYLKLGQRQGAIAELRKSMELKPEFKV
ncbi:MAG: O-antigen ligase family protein, partial [Patescibacteria group bacterium]